MTDLVFFYGTLMTGFRRDGRARVDVALEPAGHGWIDALLFDLGTYPAAVPATDGRVRGEVHRVLDDLDGVFRALDEFEGYRTDAPETSLYIRREVPVRFDDGRTERAWAYFYNAPIGSAPRIESGDYLEYLKIRS